MRDLLDPKYIVAPPEPKEGTPEHLEWLKEVKPTRLIGWPVRSLKECYAAKAQEERWNPLGDGWVKSNVCDDYWENGNLELIFDGQYWELHKDVFQFELHKSIAYVDTINQLINDVKNEMSNN